ncbi:Gfo/Idh/MocA family protein [Mumia zhuanghuii]|uniref:Gfo/Idh/MocA family oxidoreductase n=1 Tax=Mumia zhuanghuii TaxID=2585211 RepID=A0A5C4ML99_9ACTN|nr:Gfo/Idh/MocA family oxidoreductase [Mumia zhuanghuii]TNC46209.1 Gfo/Idh/MocA family oxidoreductase [Mumia zhuanghuii]TNC46374.1 Gfo/Idh/MocA family oxidoreductase [Mumia zhuanghuii]
MTHPPIRWGILATGDIAHSFARDLALLDDAVLHAVGSRSLSSARAFADEYTVADARPHPYGSYEDLLADPDVDVVYVATPHGRHTKDVLACFDAGKAVLCEKALTLDSASARLLVDEARRRGLFFAEAMWTRLNPHIVRMREMVAEGACGEVRQVRADLGFVAPADKARLWDPALGASALLDVGIYPLTFAYLILGRPDQVRAAAALSSKGVDLTGGATLRYDSGAVATISWSQVAWSDGRASIAGDGGRIEVPSPMNNPRRFTYARYWESDEIALPVVGEGYAHEIAEVGRCLREGLTESALLPLDETVEILAVMDEIRAQVGSTTG